MTYIAREFASDLNRSAMTEIAEHARRAAGVQDGGEMLPSERATFAALAQAIENVLALAD